MAAGGALSEDLTYPGRSGPVRAHLRQPATGGPWPAVILIRALLTSVSSINTLAHRLADEGYLALAPDHYANDPVVGEVSTEDILQGIEIALSGDIAHRLEAAPAGKRATLVRVVGWWDTRDVDYVQDLLPAVTYLGERGDVRPEAMAVIGFGGGGGLTGRLLSAGVPVQAAAIFAGRLPPVDAESVANVRAAAVVAHYGGRDSAAALVPPFESAMRARGKLFYAYIYPGVGHLFFDAENADYDPSAATLAWERTYEFLRAQLRAPAGAA